MLNVAQAAPDYQCWDGYWDDEETGIWNCDLKTYVSPPAATKEKGKQVVDNGGLLEEEPDFLFEKRYDALRTSAEATGNLLNGTCQLGQLIMRGYNQELQNGQHLRQAYFYDGDKTQEEHAANDARLRLWDVTKTGGQQGRRASTPAIGDPTKAIYQEPNLRYRADDEQVGSLPAQDTRPTLTMSANCSRKSTSSAAHLDVRTGPPPRPVRAGAAVRPR